MTRGFYLGNELIAYAAAVAGASSAYAYPGTPSSEILSSFQKFASESYAQWALNEKLALELSAAAAISGSYSFCSMKQVGLNVAADPLFSVAYTGVEGALAIISADDPGPHSSQTEQDSRLYAYAAKIPVLDPSSPKDAFRLTLRAFEISKKYSVPVMVRPVMRVCHSRSSFELPPIAKPSIKGSFAKDTSRWAATPKYRAFLHRKLMDKLELIAETEFENILPYPVNRFAILASGYPYAVCADMMEKYKDKADLIKIDMPYPVSFRLIEKLEKTYDKILILEETFPLLERTFMNRAKIFGKDTGSVPSAGEFTAEGCEKAADNFLGIKRDRKTFYETTDQEPPAKPRLCPGCGHRGAFYAIKKGAPGGIFPGDIGCYTLGTNLKAVDSCVCMGASITFAESLKRENPGKSVICSIGDSTFFHTGIPALLNAKVNDAPIVVAILDNETTAMTGFQPVPHAQGKASLENILKGLGIDWVVITDPYKINDSAKAVKEALKYAEDNKTPAVVIFRRECVTRLKTRYGKRPVINENCSNCGVCFDIFECPAITTDGEKAVIDETLCSGCKCCAEICPRLAIEEKE